METLDHGVEPTEIVAGRYQLRPPSARDVPDMMELSRDPDVALWNPIASGADEETAQAWAERYADWDGGRSPLFGVYEAVEGRLLALVSLHKIDFGLSAAELGYRVAPWARGRGVATMALGTVSQWAFGALELTRLQLIHAVENAASCRVAEKCGFRHEGTTRSSYRYGDGELHDEHIHGRLVSDPLPLR